MEEGHWIDHAPATTTRPPSRTAFRVVRTIASVVALSFSSCHELEPPPPRAAFSIGIRQDSAPAADVAASCSLPVGNLLLPPQDDRLVLTISTREDTLDDIEFLGPQEDGSHVSCRLLETGETTFKLSARIVERSTGGKLNLAIDDIDTSTSTASELARLSWDYESQGLHFGTCSVVVASSEGYPVISQDRTHLGYSCDRFANAEGNTCSAVGIIVLDGCL